MLCCKKIFWKRNSLLVLMAFFLWSCHEKKDSTICYKKPPSEILNSTCTWLNKDENFNKPSYMPSFYTYYNKKIKEKKFMDASRALEIVLWKTCCFQWFRASFLQTIITFSKLYRSKIPAINTSYIDNYLGNYYSDQGNYKKAISYYEKMSSFEAIDFRTSETKAIGYFNMAWCYNSLGKQNLAFNCNLKALKYYKKIDDKPILGVVYAAFAEIYKTTKDYKNSEKNIDSAIYYYSLDRHNQEGNIFITLINKIDLYNQINDTIKKNRLIDSTFTAFNHSKLISLTIKTDIYASKIYKLLDENKITETKKLLDELKLIVIGSNSVIGKQDYDLCYTSYEIKKNNGFIDSNKIIRAIPVLLENENYARLRDFYSVLYKNAITKKDFKNALNYSQKITIAIDSLQSKKMANKVAELNQKYQTQNKEQQIIHQEKTILKRDSTIALLGIAIASLLLLVFGIIIKHKQRKLKLEKQHAQLFTKQLLAKTEEERKRIASDLHDSISHDLLELKNVANGNLEETNIKIDGIINDIRSISRNLHPIMFDKIGLKASIEQMVERAQVANGFMVTADVDYKSSLSSSDELQVYRIIQEALSNIIKYADAVAAKILVTEKEKIIFIEIKDNGKGFNVNKILNSTDAFGLHNIIERSRAIGGKAKIKSNKNGTIVTIIINKIK